MAAVSKDAKKNKEVYWHEIYYWYRDHGICPRCRVASTFGKVTCDECLKKINRQNAHRVENGEYKRRSKERRERLKAQGLCCNCGKRKAVENRVLCTTCAKKNKEQQQVKRIRDRIKEAEK